MSVVVLLNSANEMIKIYDTCSAVVADARVCVCVSVMRKEVMRFPGEVAAYDGDPRKRMRH